MFEKIKSNKIYPIVFLTLIVLISVSLLLWINSFTSKVVESQQKAKILSILESVFTDMDDYKTDKDIFLVYKDSEVTGYAFLADGKGYGGKISMLVGLNMDYSIRGISILSQTETPGLGSKIAEGEFTDQFKGLFTDDINLSGDGGKIDAITGATISSKAVTEAVRAKMIEIIEKLGSK